MHGGVVNENTPLLHHLLDMAQAQRVGNIPAHANQHHFQRVVEPLENFAQGAIDQTFTEIMHGSDCPTSLLRHNPITSPVEHTQYDPHCCPVRPGPFERLEPYEG